MRGGRSCIFEFEQGVYIGILFVCLFVGLGCGFSEMACLVLLRFERFLRISTILYFAALRFEIWLLWSTPLPVIFALHISLFTFSMGQVAGYLVSCFMVNITCIRHSLPGKMGFPTCI